MSTFEDFTKPFLYAVDRADELDHWTPSLKEVVLAELSGDKYDRLLDEALRKAFSFSLVRRDDMHYESTDDLLESMERFRIKVERVCEWLGTATDDPADVFNFRVNKESLRVLKNVGSLSDWLAPEYPEDLAFFDAIGTPLFGSVTHHGTAMFFKYGLDVSRILPEETAEWGRSHCNFLQ